MNNTYKALIIDDERLARKDLITMLSGNEKIQVVGEADDVPSALHAIQKHHPDVIFLDIQMPGESGFDLVEKIQRDIKIIFVTAYDEFAIRAFEINALDYLLKPINPDRLTKAIERLEENHTAGRSRIRKLGYDDRLFLMLGNHFKFLKVNTILCITAAGDYSEVTNTRGERHLTLKTMKEWEYRLPPQYFIRIHRSAVINMEYIDRLEEWFNYSFRVYLKGLENPLVMSRRYASKLKEKMG
jgi:two-component system LytT family response regulator